MKLLILSFFLVSFHLASARGMDDQLEASLTKDIGKLNSESIQLLNEERELRSRIQNLSKDSPEAGREQAKLKEIQQVIAAVAEGMTRSQERLLQLQSSPLHRIVASIAKDKRHPSKANLSGSWSSGPNLCGYTIQLEQKANSIKGQGHYWGCMGNFEAFQITGAYRAGVLSLTFKIPTKADEKHVLNYTEDRRLPCFEERIGKYIQRITPVYELR